MSEALQRITREYRWGIVDANEPPGVRTIRGFVTVLEFCAPNGAPLDYVVAFFDTDGRPIPTFQADEFKLFACAAGLAMKALGLPHEESSGHPAELIVLT